MGLYIKGMEMPTKGEYHMTLYVCDDGYAYMDVDLFPVDKDRFEAVHVPPHGRLIDADTLMPNAKYRGEYDILTAFDVVAAPTIIPTEEGEKNERFN